MAKIDTQVKKAAKKAIKKNPKAFIIAIIAIVIILAIVIAVVYFTNPDLITDLLNGGANSSYYYEDNNGNSSNINSGSNSGTGSGTNLNKSDGELLIHYIDVEQGDCMIIEFPDNKTMIIDGGDTAYAETVKAAMDELSITSFDYVLLTHTDADHCGSLDDAVNYATSVTNIYLPKIKSKDYDLGLSSDYKLKNTVVYNNFVKAASNATYKDANGETKSANLIFTEDIITIEDEAHTYKFTMYCRSDDYYQTMKISNSHDINDVSPICVLEFNNRIALFTGDANASTIDTSSEKNFLDNLKALGYIDDDDPTKDTFDADILKVPHHGGKDSSGKDFLDFIDVEYAIVSVGGNQDTDDDDKDYTLFISEDLAEATDYTIYGNESYGHPTGAVCSEGGRLDASGVEQVYYTWFNGDITCKIDKDGNITFSADKKAVLNGNVVEYKAA